MFGIENGLPDVDLSGIHIGKVVNNQDAKGLLRVEVTIPGITAENVTLWAQRVSPTKFASDTPAIGDYLYVMFLNPHDPMSAVWIGYVNSL